MAFLKVLGHRDKLQKVSHKEMSYICMEFWDACKLFL